MVLACVGRLRSKELGRLCEEYAKRLNRYGAFEIIEVKAATARDPQAGVREESQRLLALLKPGDELWVLDERGRMESSPGWAAGITQLENRRVKRLMVILGGAYGMDEALRKKGRLQALSKMTFPHELCRLIVLEQLYRARTIQRGEPYHHP